MAGDVELEQPEDRPHCNPLQTIGAPREPGGLVGNFTPYQGYAESNNDAGQNGAPEHQEAGDEAEYNRRQAPNYQTHDWLGDPVLGEKAGYVGAKTQIGRMADRNNPCGPKHHSK